MPYRNFVPRKITVRTSTVHNFFRTVIPYLSVPHFFNQFTSRKIQQETFAIAFFKIFNCLFILLSRKSDQSAIRACLRVASRLPSTPRLGNPAKCISKQPNKYTCRLVLHTVPLMLNVEQGRCEYQF